MARLYEYAGGTPGNECIHRLAHEAALKRTVLRVPPTGLEPGLLWQPAHSFAGWRPGIRLEHGGDPPAAPSRRFAACATLTYDLYWCAVARPCEQSQNLPSRCGCSLQGIGARIHESQPPLRPAACFPISISMNVTSRIPQYRRRLT